VLSCLPAVASGKPPRRDSRPRCARNTAEHVSRTFSRLCHHLSIFCSIFFCHASSVTGWKRPAAASCCCAGCPAPASRHLPATLPGSSMGRPTPPQGAARHGCRSVSRDTLRCARRAPRPARDGTPACVQELIGSTEKPRAVLVCLDDIQRRLEGSPSRAAESTASRDAGPEEDPSLAAWKEARGKKHDQCLLAGSRHGVDRAHAWYLSRRGEGGGRGVPGDGQRQADHRG